jgi:hypothetical protein
VCSASPLGDETCPLHRSDNLTNIQHVAPERLSFSFIMSPHSPGPVNKLITKSLNAISQLLNIIQVKEEHRRRTARYPGKIIFF